MGNRNIPEVRFSGFAGEWEQCTLHSMVDRVKSYSLSRDVETSAYTGYKYIHYGDIHTKVADIIDEFSELPNIKAGNYELLEKGDLVLADASEDYQGIATPAVVTIDVPYKLLSGLHTIALRPKQVDSLFLYYLINSPIFRKYGYKTGTGMKVFGISATNLLKFESLFPVLEEQNKIGNFFKQLDDTIALHQQALTTLKQTKQGFLQKMFPKEGESVPEVRFPGFTGEWEERKLGELGKIRSGIGFPDSEQGGRRGIPFYKVSDMNNIGNESEMLNSNNYVTNEQIKKNKWKPIEDVPSVIFAKVGAALMLNRKRLVTTPFFIDNNIMAFSFDETWDMNFGYILFQTLFFPRYAQVGALPSFNASDIESINIKIPVKEEQTKIGNFFKQLDDMIALHQRELDALKETKKAFLQKMFV